MISCFMGLLLCIEVEHHVYSNRLPRVGLLLLRFIPLTKLAQCCCVGLLMLRFWCCCTGFSAILLLCIHRMYRNVIVLFWMINLLPTQINAQVDMIINDICIGFSCEWSEPSETSCVVRI